MVLLGTDVEVGNTEDIVKDGTNAGVLTNPLGNPTIAFSTTALEVFPEDFVTREDNLAAPFSPILLKKSPHASDGSKMLAPNSAL